MKTRYILCSLIVAIPILLSVSDGYDGVLYTAPSKSVAQAGIVINDDNLYIADNDEIVTYDLSSPATPREVGRQYMSQGVDSIYLFKQLLVVSRENAYSSVYDISSPNNLTSSGVEWYWNTCNNVVLAGSHAFVMDKPGYTCTAESMRSGISFYKFDDNNVAQSLGNLPMENITAAAATEKVLFVSVEKKGMYYISADSMYTIGTADGRIYSDMKIAGTRLYGRSKTTLDCYDITVPYTPILLSQLPN